jgi:hypothetical protein
MHQLPCSQQPPRGLHAAVAGESDWQFATGFQLGEDSFLNGGRFFGCALVPAMVGGLDEMSDGVDIVKFWTPFDVC